MPLNSTPKTMNYYRHILIICLFLACLPIRAAELPEMLRASLDSLDTTISQYPALLEKKHAYIDSLVINNIKPGEQPNYKQLLTIAKAYDGFNVDSAAAYYYAASLLIKPNTQELWSTHLDLASQFGKMDRFSDAYSIIEKLNTEPLSHNNKLKFYGIASRLYLDDLNFSSTIFNREVITKKAIEMLDSLSSYLMPNSTARWLVDSRVSFLRGDHVRAIGELNEALESYSPGTPIYAMIAAMLAECYADRPDKLHERAYYLALSAIADLKNVNCDAASLAFLGEALMQLGDKDRSFRYLELASKIMKDGGSRMYLTITSHRFIDVASRVHEADNHTIRAGIIVIITLTLLIIGLSAVIFSSRIRAGHDAKDKKELRESVANRELYINQLLKLCSSYVDGFEEFTKFVTRKIKANQSVNLLSTIESGRLMQEFSEKFFAVFDEAVLKIFPDFVSELNTLLLPDKQVDLPSPGRLTPELRILAFMRLGVTDSNRISKFLSLSLNTVYTYRNRMKNRAIDRENFENQVLKIL